MSTCQNNLKQGKVLQEKKIDITALINNCQPYSNDFSFTKIANNFLELIDTIRFHTDENGNEFVYQRNLSYIEKHYINETFNQKMTNKIKSIIPYPLNKECPDIVDQSLLLEGFSV